MKRNTIIGALIFAAFGVGLCGFVYTVRIVTAHPVDRSERAPLIWANWKQSARTVYRGTYALAAHPWEYANDEGCKGVAVPLAIDNRALCVPTLDQTETECCGGFAAAAYFAALHWKHTGEMLTFDGVALRGKQAAHGKHPHTGGDCPPCYFELAKDVCGYCDDYGFAVLRNDGTPRAVLEMKRVIHQHGLALLSVNAVDTWAHDTMCHGGFIIPAGGVEPHPHCVVACGYNAHGFIVQNSWGRDWVVDGFAVLQYEDFIKHFKCAYYPARKDNERKTNE